MLEGRAGPLGPPLTWFPGKFPVFRIAHKSFPNRILSDVMGLFIIALVAAQPVIEKITLPEDVCRLGDNLFPIRNDFGRVSVLGKRNQGVKVIGHQEAEMNIPVATPLAKFDGFPNGCGHLVVAKLVGLAGSANNGDKENRIIIHPGRNSVREFLPWRGND